MPLFTITNQQKDLKISKKRVRSLFQGLIEFKKLSINEIEVHFITDRAMKKKHLELFSDPSSTDCITIPIDPIDSQDGYCLLGACYICPKTALNYATLHNINPYQELSLYCVHCFLHLIGYDDIEKSDRIKMRKAEKLCLDYLDSKQLLL